MMVHARALVAAAAGLPDSAPGGGAAAAASKGVAVDKGAAANKDVASTKGAPADKSAPSAKSTATADKAANDGEPELSELCWEQLESARVFLKAHLPASWRRLALAHEGLGELRAALDMATESADEFGAAADLAGADGQVPAAVCGARYRDYGWTLWSATLPLPTLALAASGGTARAPRPLMSATAARFSFARR